MTLVSGRVQRTRCYKLTGAAAPVAPVLMEGLGQEWHQADVCISILLEELECGYFLLFSKMTCHFSQVIKVLYFSLVMFFSKLLKGLFFSESQCMEEILNQIAKPLNGTITGWNDSKYILHETWSKLVPHELIILTKFHKDRAKIVDFLLIANFGMCAVFFYSDFIIDSYICIWSISSINCDLDR